jgi:hypothetical protein
VDLKNAKIGAKTTKLWLREGVELMCKDLKRFWAKIKKKELNCRESSKVEGYCCEYLKT